MKPGHIAIDKIKLGDQATFEEAFHAYYKALVIYANTILKDMDESEDIVQQVFVSVWEKREALEVHTSVRALLYKATYNASLNRLKHKQVRVEYAKEIQLHGQPVAVQDSLSGKELNQKIELALSELPEQCARIFKMSRFDHLKYQEIADQLGLSVKTVENQMGKALKIMRTHLKDYLPALLLILSLYYRD